MRSGRKSASSSNSLNRSGPKFTYARPPRPGGTLRVLTARGLTKKLPRSVIAPLRTASQSGP
eukprot:11223080-Heterocapsa_arctica.AAC.1